MTNTAKMALFEVNPTDFHGSDLGVTETFKSETRTSKLRISHVAGWYLILKLACKQALSSEWSRANMLK